MIKSIQTGINTIEKNDRYDPAWEFSAANQDADSSRVKMQGIPILKQYGNTHKYQLECRQIVINNINDYVNKPSQNNREERKMLLENMKDGLKLYDKIHDLGGISCINKKLNNILENAKELDRSEVRLAKVSSNYKSPSKDEDKMGFAKKIDETISEAYKALNEKLIANDVETLPETAIIKGINKTMISFKNEIKKIGQEAMAYNEKKHPGSQWNKTRFETKTELNIARRKRSNTF